MKEVYMAGRLDSSEYSIGEFATELEQRGHHIMEKWWELGPLPKPYLDHPQTSTRAAETMINAAYNSNVFILFPTDDILGAGVELGAAIASKEVKRDKLVIAVNPFEVRQSVFYAHPAVLAVRGIEQIRRMRFY